MARKHGVGDAAVMAASARVRVRNDWMPGLRIRHDGWTQARTQRFLDTLAYTGCVRDAARVTGLSSQAGYRLKQRYPVFSTAWDEALNSAQAGLVAIAYRRAVEGRETVVMRNGVEYERRITPSDSLLALLLKRGDLAGEKFFVDPDTVLSFSEWKNGYVFDGKTGEKYLNWEGDRDEAEIERKLDLLRAHTARRIAESGACWHCGQPLLTDEAREKMMGNSGALRAAMGDIEIANFTMIAQAREDEVED